jgi:hypothetical protein
MRFSAWLNGDMLNQCGSFSVISYQLSVISYQFSVFSYQLSIINDQESKPLGLAEIQTWLASKPLGLAETQT